MPDRLSSAFTDEEIKAVHDWVTQRGALTEQSVLLSEVMQAGFIDL